MADKKVTQLTALTAPANTDLLLIVDDPTGTPVSKKIELGDLFGESSQTVFILLQILHQQAARQRLVVTQLLLQHHQVLHLPRVL